MADERIEAAQQFSTITPCDEQAGWDWLARMVEAVSDEAPEDITYSADQMVDAFMAGRQTRPAPKADGALVGELAYHAETLQKVKDVLANGAHFADDPECHPLYPNYVVAVGAILTALSDRDVVLEEAATERERAAFIGGYRAAHMVPDAYDSTSAAEEAWAGYQLVTRALKGGVDE